MKVWSIFFPILLLFSKCYSQQIPPCFYQLETNFFTYDVVATAFNLNYVYQAQWVPLYNALQSNARKIPSMIEERARKSNPNPLNPFNPVAASELLRQVLFDVFNETMHESLYTNETAIRQMFRYIRAEKSLLLSSCLGEASEADQRITR